MTYFPKRLFISPQPDEAQRLSMIIVTSSPSSATRIEITKFAARESVNRLNILLFTRKHLMSRVGVRQAIHKIGNYSAPNQEVSNVKVSHNMGCWPIRDSYKARQLHALSINDTDRLLRIPAGLCISTCMKSVPRQSFEGAGVFDYNMRVKIPEDQFDCIWGRLK